MNRYGGTSGTGQVRRGVVACLTILALLAGGVMPAAAAPRGKNVRGFRVVGATVTEGDTGTRSLVFTVTLDGTTRKTATVRYATAARTATPPGDFQPTTGMLSFPRGTTSQTVTVPVFGDLVDEPDETFALTLSGATRAKILVAQADGTILDDDLPPEVRVEAASAPEGEPGVGSSLVFPVRLDRPSGHTVTVEYATSSTGFTASAGTDYTAVANATLTFLPGQTSLVAPVSVLGDATEEPDETLQVTLANPVNATLGASSAVGTIIDNDPLTTPNLVIADAANAEGASFTFPIAISPAAPSAFDLRYDVVAGSAQSPADLPAVENAAIAVPEGATLVNLVVQTTEDDLDELAERFFVNIRLDDPAFPASIEDGQAVGTIEDDDAPPVVSAGDAVVSEGDDPAAPNYAYVPVSLSEASGRQVSVQYQTADGTALAGTDYTAASGELVFQPGVVAQTVAVAVIGNLEDQPDRAFTLTLTLLPDAPATLGDASAMATILDDEAAALPTVTVDDPTVTEGDAGPYYLPFTVRLSDFSDDDVTVRYQVTPPGGPAGSIEALVFAPGDTEQIVVVPLVGDRTVGGDLVYTLTLVDAAPGIISATEGVGTGTVLENDDESQPVAVSVADAVATEGDEDDTALQFVVTLSSPASAPLAVEYATTGWTALAGEDFASVVGRLNFAVGQDTSVILVRVEADHDTEGEEKLLLQLSAPSGGLEIGDGQAVGTIVDDDVAAAVPSLAVSDAVVQESASAFARFDVRLSSPAPAGGLTVGWTTSTDTASAEDFTHAPGTVVIPAGAQAATIAIPVVGDRIDEASTEQFFIDVTAPGVTLARGRGVGTIIDNDDLLPLVSIGDVTVHNGPMPGTVIVTVPVSIDEPSSVDVVVTYSIPSPSGGDPIMGTVTIPAGQTSAAGITTVVGDLDAVSGAPIALVDATNAVINPADGAAVPAVLPVASIIGVIVTEGLDPGTSIVLVDVSLDVASEEDVTVVVTVPPASGSGPGTDIAVVIPAGETSGSGHAVVVGAPSDVAATPVVIAGVTNGVASTTEASQTAEVVDTPVVGIADVDVNPGPTPGTSIVVVAVVIDEPADSDVVVEFTIPPATADGSPTTGTIVIPAGETTATGAVVVAGAPAVVAGNGGVVLTDAEGAVIDPNRGSSDEVDELDLPVVSIGDVTVSDSATAGSVVVLIPITLDRASSEPVTVTYSIPSTVPGGAPTVGTVTFAPGSTSESVQVTVPGTTDQVAGSPVTLVDAEGAILNPGDLGDVPSVVVDDSSGVPSANAPSTGGATDHTTGAAGAAAAKIDGFKRVATGYRMVASDGGIFTFGDAPFFGSTGDIKLNKPIVGMATSPSGDGYWLVASDGGIFTFGDAAFHGSTGALRLNRPIVGMETTPSGNGYWLVADDGGIFTFGDAEFQGSTGALKLNKPIVGMEATPSGKGYWLVATDGGIFAFGDAAFLGSTGDIRLNQPIVGMAASPSGAGYWLVATDGGIFTFGDAQFLGSTGDIRLNQPIVGMAASPSGAGYWLVATDGGIFTFGDAQFLGSTGDIRLNQPINGMAPVLRAVPVN